MSPADTTYRLAGALALAGAVLLVGLSLGVGVIGRAGDPADRMYVGVLAVGAVGALRARFRPRGMARALFATATATAAVAVVALVAGLGRPWTGPLEVVALNGLFVALFAGSAGLFLRAARERAPGGPGSLAGEGESTGRPPRRRYRAVLFGVGVALAGVLVGTWREGSIRGGQRYAEPFRIAGDLYYVGADDVASFLLTGPEGHVLIDGGYPGTAPMIMASIAELGFDIRDVRVLLNSEPHVDHAGGLAELQEASGAELWASEASADVLASGGDDRDIALPLRALFWTGVLGYPAPRVGHRFEDGGTVRVGPLALTAHVTPGHTRGCTSWSFPVRDGGRVLNVVSACSLVRLGVGPYPGQRADFERTFGVLRGLPADIWVTSHARLFGRYRKFVARDTAASPVDPFVDREGYAAYVDSAEARLRRGVVH
jgi:metallo-beta-lactamase class B